MTMAYRQSLPVITHHLITFGPPIPTLQTYWRHSVMTRCMWLKLWLPLLENTLLRMQLFVPVASSAQ